MVAENGCDLPLRTWIGDVSPTTRSCIPLTQDDEPSSAHKRLLGNGELHQGLGDDERKP